MKSTKKRNIKVTVMARTDLKDYKTTLDTV